MTLFIATFTAMLLAMLGLGLVSQRRRMRRRGIGPGCGIRDCCAQRHEVGR